MRDIKFRIKLNKKTVNAKIPLTATHYTGLINKENCISIFPNIKDWEVTSVDQYTGLEDKNGVDIYENDYLNVLVAVAGNGDFVDPRRVVNHEIKTVKIRVEFHSGWFALDSDFIPDDKQALWLWNDIVKV